MHDLNRRFWMMCVEKYHRYFHNCPRVLEVGSLDVNGTLRDYCEGIETYIGVDWRPGPCVDVVSLAHDMKFAEPFNSVVSASMLEHDPYWYKSIPNMVNMMRDDGILVLSWGGADNKPHCFEAAPDGKFHALPAGNVTRLLEKLGMYIHEFRYESSFAKDTDTVKQPMGCIGLVAFKGKSHAMGDRVVEEMTEADKA